MSNRSNSRNGVALIMVLVLIMMLSLGAYTFTNLMIAQERATVMMGRRAQAQAAVVSGVEYLKDYLAMTPEDQVTLGGHWDNADYFDDVIVVDGPEGMVRFAIISVIQDQYGGPTGIRFGLEDQGTKININEVVSSDRYKNNSEGDEEVGGNADGEEEEEDIAEDVDPFADPQRDVLMPLPLMTEVIADAILDWIDEDSEPRPFGAEAESYSFIEPSNEPISSLDELLLVQGVTPELLYGADRNHNGIIDDSEQEAAATLTTADRSMARGWSAYLTVNSKDVLAQVEPIDLNQDDLETLFDELVTAGFDEDFSSYVAAYRQNGPYQLPLISEDAPDDFELPVSEPIDGRTVDLTKDGGEKLSSVLDLIGTFVEIEFEDSREPVLVQAPYGDDSDLSAVLPQLLAGLTVGESGGTGRVNTNACSSVVLASIPGMDADMVQQILDGQDPGGMSGDLNYMYPTWPLAQGIVTIEQMKTLMPYVSASGLIYRAQVVGYSEVPGVFARTEVVIDASDGNPRVVSWRDITHLGLGFSFETLTTSQ